MEARKLDQQTAAALLAEGGALVLLGVPAGSQFGVDLRCWSTEEHFRGVKMIPPGLHYVHYAAVSQATGTGTGDVASRNGFMHYFKKKEFVVKLWDKASEELSRDEVSEESVQRLRDNLLSLDRHLAPYPYEIWPKWKQLTSHITAELAERLSPESGIIRASVELMSTTDADRPRGVRAAPAPGTPGTPETPEGSAAGQAGQAGHSGQSGAKTARRVTREEKEEAMLPHLQPVPGAALRLPRVPARAGGAHGARAGACAPPGCAPHELTRHCLDRSYTLERHLDHHLQPVDIIGELQFAYLCFLIGHSLDALEHWTELVALLCSCEEALHAHRPVYFQFVRTLQVQLEEMPQEFLADIVTSRNLVYTKLRQLFRTARVAGADARLLAAMERLRDRLARRLQWDFSGMDEEEEDERPVVVPLQLSPECGGTGGGGDIANQ